MIIGAGTLTFTLWISYENLTIDDFDEKDINIGDVLEIGDTRLQISQPRIPCYKVGIK